VASWFETREDALWFETREDALLTMRVLDFILRNGSRPHPEEPRSLRGVSKDAAPRKCASLYE
jgi:hypothetical protein